MESREQAVHCFWQGGAFCTENNVQFGEGGAGTFSDGKLTTRINDPSCGYILKELVRFGAPEEILYKDGGILLPDIRECETITLDLWVAIEKKKAEISGKVFDEKNINPPTFVDFRMFSNVEL